MNYLISQGKNFIALTDGVSAGSHKHWMLQMLLSGQPILSLTVEGEPVRGSAVLVNMNTLHTFSTEGLPHLTILSDPTTLLGRRFRALLQHRPFYVFPPEPVARMQQALTKALADGGSEACLAGVQEILGVFSDPVPGNEDPRVRHVLDQLEACPCDPDCHTLDFHARAVGLSASRLAHVFRKDTGIPLKSYLVLHKLQQAYAQITAGMNITAAALDAGFDSPSHLAYTHRMMTGMSATGVLKDSVFLKVPPDGLC